MNNNKACIVETCNSTSMSDRKKLFIRVPNNTKMRTTWLQLARRDPQSLPRKKSLYLCEDHFDLKYDMKNYMQYKIMGSVKRIKMKPNIVPTKFDCFNNKELDPSRFQSDYIKRQRTAVIQEAEANSNLDHQLSSFCKPETHFTQNVKNEEDDNQSQKLSENTVTALLVDKYGLAKNTASDYATRMSATQENDPSKHVCRTCLQTVEARTLFNLFQAWSPGWEGMEKTIAEDLVKLANIQISERDQHSKYICSSCFEKLYAASNFVLLVKRNDRLLNLKLLQCDEDINLNKAWPQPIQIDKNIACDNAFDVDIKQEVLSDEEYVCNMEDGYRETDFVEIKVEPEEIVKPTPSQIMVNGISVNENPYENGEASIENGEDALENSEDNDDYEYLNAKVKEEPGSDTEDTESGPIDLPLECLLCTRVFNSMSGLKAHVIAQHSYKSVKRKTSDISPRKAQKTRYPCTICKRTFTTSTDLMVHETCHNKDVCYGCNAKFDSFDLLAEHTQRCKAFSSAEVKRPKMLDDVIRPKSEESTSSEPLASVDNKESLTCSLCSEVFSDSYYMKIHQEIHHTKDTAVVKTENESSPDTMETATLESIFNENT